MLASRNLLYVPLGPEPGVPEASASTGETVIVTATALLAPAAAVLGVGGTLLTQFHLIDGVEAVIPAVVEPVLAALPGITVTPFFACVPEAIPGTGSKG